MSMSTSKGKSRNKRWFMLSLVAALCLGLLSACGGKNESGANSPGTAANGGNKEASGNEVTLRFMTWDSGQTLQPYQNAINAFMEKHPNIKVKVESVPDNYDQKLLTSLASDTAPDVFMAWNYPLYVPGGALEDMQAWVDKDNYDLGKYYPILMDYMKYDGKLWGLPTTYSTRAIYYNKKLFDEAGVPYPQDGWKWDEFVDTVQKLTKPGQYGFIMTPDDVMTMQPYVWSNGGDMVSDDGKTVEGVLNSAENVKAMTFLKQLYDASSKINSAGKFSTNNGLESFQTGQIAMFDNGMWPLGDILKEGKLDIGTVTHPLPEGGSLKGIIHTSGYSMPKSGKNKEAAWELIKFMSGEEGIKIITANKFAFSPVISVDEENGYATDPYLEAFAKELEGSDKLIASMRNEKWSEAEDMIRAGVQSIFYNNADIQSTLNDAAKQAQAVLK
ncbi:ABC transporter substrate-binding protein [Paenibacillus sp. YSY-4.3]